MEIAEDTIMAEVDGMVTAEVITTVEVTTTEEDIITKVIGTTTIRLLPDRHPNRGKRTKEIKKLLSSRE